MLTSANIVCDLPAYRKYGLIPWDW